MNKIYWKQIGVNKYGPILVKPNHPQPVDMFWLDKLSAATKK